MARSVLRHATAFGLTVFIIAVACAPKTDTPKALRTGRSVYGDGCSTCHGDAGQGGVGPSLYDVLETFPSCADHMEWITLGSEGWKNAHGPTYGANDTEITKPMPAHGEKLSADEIAAVAAFERVEYGGGDAAAELADCGLGDD